MWLRNSRNSHHRPRQFRPRLEALDDRCLPSGGVLDPTFGTGGIVTTSVGSQSSSRALAVATYSNTGTANDGKIVAAGEAVTSLQRVGGTWQPDEDFAVVRYNLDGSLDKSFGGSGKVTTDLGSLYDEAFDVLVQSDGKIVAVGQVGSSSGRSLALVRYNTDGSLDTSFGGNTAKGKVITSISKGSFDIGVATALQTDGKIVVAGMTEPKGATYNELFLVRYNADGTLDTSFGSGGKVTQHFASSIGSTPDFGNGVDLAIDAGTGPLDPNAGKFVVEAQLSDGTAMGGGAAVVRYNRDGSLDSSFGGGAGYVTLRALGGTTTAAVAVQPDDRIVVAGDDASAPFNGSNISLARLNANGTLDASFGSGGIVVTPLPTQATADVALQSDGKIVVAGVEGNSLALSRYNPTDGSLDTSFGSNGVATTSGVNVMAFKVAAALEPDGRIVVAGTLDHSFGFAVARFLAAGSQIGSFTASPNRVTAGSSLNLTASNITDTNPNSTITQVAFYVDSNNDGLLEPGADTLLGYAIQTSPGVWTITFTVNLSPGTCMLFAQAEDTYGVLGDPVSLALTIQ